jgi:hypothetical protein
MDADYWTVDVSIDVDDPEDRDGNDDTGLTEEAYLRLMNALTSAGFSEEAYLRLMNALTSAGFSIAQITH